MNVLTGFTAIPLAFITWQCYKLYNNYVIARTIGVPVLITPFGALHPIWQVGRWLTALLKFLPFGLGDFANYDPLSSYLPDRYHRHAKLGDAYVVASPSSNILMLANAKAADDVLSRRKDFIKHPSMYDPLNVYGPNVDTLNGEEWQRHRRLTTPPFNERNSDLVWRETIKQAQAMLKKWLLCNPSGVRHMDEDSATLALHVLTGAGFGQPHVFGEGLSKPGSGHTMTCRDSLRYILHHMMVSIILGMVKIPPYLLFGSIRKGQLAMTEFGRYMTEMVENERKAIQQEEKSKENLLSVLVRTSDANAAKGDRNHLTSEEIYGNLFVYCMAGHDTSAGVLHHSIILMAAFPEVQGWVYEELMNVLISIDPQDWDYNATFPRLKRCLAVIYETVRYIGAVPLIPKHTDKSPQSINLGDRDLLIPPETFVFLQLPALHSKPEYWGEDSLQWRPSRWLSTDANGADFFLEPEAGSFVGWAAGPRVCPGKKFAQVEFVATFATLFRRNIVKPVLERGETLKEAQVRLSTKIQDVNMGASFRVNDPQRLALTWEERP